jgi:putative methionine-R-sulfoxide reductase with GAF domain
VSLKKFKSGVVGNSVGRLDELERRIHDELGHTRRQIEQFELFLNLSTVLNSSLDPNQIQVWTMEAVQVLVRTEASSLLLYDEETDELFFEVALGEKGDKVKPFRMPANGQSIASWVFQNNRPLLLEDVKSDPRHAGKIDNESGFETRDMICVPLRVKERVIGVLQAINKHEGVPTNQDLDLLLALANQVAFAIENARLYMRLHRAFHDTAYALAEAIEVRDPYTGGHTRRVTRYSLAIARYMDLSAEEMNTLKLSAILHDVGKIGIDDAVLRKADRLTDEEFALMKKHPEFGADIMKEVPSMSEVIPGILFHHERFDGKGYPRCYRKGLDPEVARAEIERCSGTQFDPECVEAFLIAYKHGEIVLDPEDETTQEAA